MPADRRSVGGGKVSRGGPLRVHGIWPGSVQWVGVEFQCARQRKPSGKSGIPWTCFNGLALGFHVPHYSFLELINRAYSLIR